MARAQNPAHAACAWDDVATQRTWSKLFTSAVVGQIVWPVVSVGSFVLMILLGQWSMWFMLPVAVYALYRTVLQRRYIVSAVQARRILRVYPWQVHRTPKSGIGQITGAKLGDVWLAFPDPDQPESLVPIVLHGHARSAWWRRRLGRGYETDKTRQVAEVWFAGDVRFAGVIAVPGPRRLFLLFQLAANPGIPGQNKTSLDAVERARRAGVRLAP
ncbi:hypothetical protein [Streptomyces brasiliensis]|uniref:Uncharacterized protein n=1 Tax=Streptomyces brasiliensis TaxID=1954 RepID=A0A917KMW7_9ACTN|nr:hypothetical protein [Streptomyces brasiliensis]GGJ18320.1 hypothetical protein GCM10010121_031630 [Streptomyces brasiliensis]